MFNISEKQNKLQIALEGIGFTYTDHVKFAKRFTVGGSNGSNSEYTDITIEHEIAKNVTATALIKVRVADHQNNRGNIHFNIAPKQDDVQDVINFIQNFKFNLTQEQIDEALDCGNFDVEVTA